MGLKRNTALIAEKSKRCKYVMKPAVLALTFASMYWGECWAQLKDETLVATIPTGFKIGSQTNHDRVTTLEWIKESESLQNWTEMVTVQVDRGSNKTTAPQFLQGIGTKWLHACKDSVANQKPDAEANGYPISMLLVHCPLNATTGKPETIVFRVIKGNDALYSIQKTFKFDPSSEQLKQIMKYLNGVNVCDPRRTDHPCPKLD
jgi:hypothetical protein